MIKSAVDDILNDVFIVIYNTIYNVQNYGIIFIHSVNKDVAINDVMSFNVKI